MGRHLSDPAPQRPTAADPWRGYDQCQLEITLVTPMLGGGVQPGEPDPVTLIRPSSIRGHLRFWWRATRGAAFADPVDLKRREVEIWGDTDNPSPVLVQVESQPVRQYREPPDYGFARFGAEAYALFSAKDKAAILCQEGMKFSIMVHWPGHELLQQLRRRENERRKRTRQELLSETVNDISPDVQAGLWAWLNFGGLGARTRRGCGAIHSPEMPFARLDRQTSSPIAAKVLCGARCPTPLDAWRHVLDVYQRFRQGFRGAKHNKHLPNGKVLNNIPGRSYWPEPDSIRQITGSALRPKPGTAAPSVPDDVNTHDHSRPIVPVNLLPCFPRAL